jgi:hypothetical protein
MQGEQRRDGVNKKYLAWGERPEAEWVGVVDTAKSSVVIKGDQKYVKRGYPEG